MDVSGNQERGHGEGPKGLPPLLLDILSVAPANMSHPRYRATRGCGVSSVQYLLILLGSCAVGIRAVFLT